MQTTNGTLQTTYSQHYRTVRLNFTNGSKLTNHQF